MWLYFYRISFSSLEITPISFFISSQSTSYSIHLLSSSSLWHITHLSALYHLPSSSSCLCFSVFVMPHLSILPFSFSFSSSILLAFPFSLYLTLVFLCSSSFLHYVLVFTALPVTPAQFKYRGHFLPISPGARRAPRFAARRKVPVWAVVQWCHSNTNHAVNCFLWGEDRRTDWIETGFPFSSGTTDAVMETDIGMGHSDCWCKNTVILVSLSFSPWVQLSVC